MDIKEAKELKQKTEDVLRELLDTYEGKTETRIDRCDIVRDYSMGSNYGRIAAIQLTVKV